MKIKNSRDMERLGRDLAGDCPAGARIYLQGELGAGKTTWVRGFLQGKGYSGKVKSPTYTLVETYRIHGQVIHHLDLYRIHDPDELESIGLRDYMDGSGICLVEWPERAAAMLGKPDVLIRIAICGSSRTVTPDSCSPAGAKILQPLHLAQ